MTSRSPGTRRRVAAAPPSSREALRPEESRPRYRPAAAEPCRGVFSLSAREDICLLLSLLSLTVLTVHHHRLACKLWGLQCSEQAVEELSSRVPRRPTAPRANPADIGSYRAAWVESHSLRTSAGARDRDRLPPRWARAGAAARCGARPAAAAETATGGKAPIHSTICYADEGAAARLRGGAAPRERGGLRRGRTL